MEIEKTELGQQEFNFNNRVIQTVLGECQTQDVSAQEDTLYYQLNTLIRQNALTEDEAQGCFMQFLGKVASNE